MSIFTCIDTYFAIGCSLISLISGTTIGLIWGYSDGFSNGYLRGQIKVTSEELNQFSQYLRKF